MSEGRPLAPSSLSGEPIGLDHRAWFHREITRSVREVWR